MIIDDELENRYSNYQRKNYDYTKARYSLPAMQFYSNLRLLKFHNILNKNLKSPFKVLDVGCGTGILLNGLTIRNPESRFTGLDFSSNMLANTVINKTNLKKVELVEGDAFNLPFLSESFDAVITSRFIHQYSIDLKEILIKEMKRVIKPGGLLAIEFYCLYPRVLNYIINSIKGDEAYTRHLSNRKQVEKIVGKNCLIEPLSLPGPNILVKISSIDFFRRLCFRFNYSKMYFLYDQFIAVARK